MLFTFALVHQKKTLIHFKRRTKIVHGDDNINCRAVPLVDKMKLGWMPTTKMTMTTIAMKVQSVIKVFFVQQMLKIL